jgi:hypothetical protein
MQIHPKCQVFLTRVPQQRNTTAEWTGFEFVERHAIPCDEVDVNEELEYGGFYLIIGLGSCHVDDITLQKLKTIG